MPVAPLIASSNPRRRIMSARNWILRTPALLGVLLTIACSHSATSSPSAPSGAQSASASGSGATINGSLTSATSVGAGSGLMALTGSGFTVTISGTNLSAIVDGTGHFALANVPTGNVQLKFAGPGTD